MSDAGGRADTQPVHGSGGENGVRARQPVQREPQEEAGVLRGPVHNDGRVRVHELREPDRQEQVQRRNKDEGSGTPRGTQGAHGGPGERARDDPREGGRRGYVLRHVRQLRLGPHRVGEGACGFPDRGVQGLQGPRLR